jgi:LuxR family maltose regulon positive regulatory protein
VAHSATVDRSPPSPFQAGVVLRRELFEQLSGAGRVTHVSAAPGSGKTYLLRSWISEAGLAERAGWVSVQRDEREPQRFWLSVLDALRGTRVGSTRVRTLTPAPDPDTWAIVEGLLEDLASLDERVCLVIDDVHELRSNEALRQLELLLMRAPAELRFVLATRHDLRLGLHRLRLERELTEIRAADLRFTLDEARALLEAAGVRLSESALALLNERTEGWVAGLRLAVLSLAAHPDPEAFAAEFAGSERTVAEYLLAEVLERQPAEVRRLLLRTAVCERVSGPLAEALTGYTDAERILQELEQANAFVVSLDVGRSWFRYHHLFSDLLQLELRRTAPDELPRLHTAAAEWFAEHGDPIEAIRHAQAAENWRLASRLLWDNGVDLYISGRAAAVHELLEGFPRAVIAADAELIATSATDEMYHGSLDEAERQLALAAHAPEPGERRAHFLVRLGLVRLLLARRRGDLPAVVEEAERLLSPAESLDAVPLGLHEDLRAIALVNLGVAELWTARLEQAERHIEQGLVLARRIDRPFMEVIALAHGAIAASFRSFSLSAKLSMEAIEVARRHGWSDDPVAGLGYAVLAAARVWQGRLEEAEQWLDRAGRALRAGVEPAAGMVFHGTRGLLESARSRDEEALAAFRAAEPLADLLVTRHILALHIRAHALQALVRMGESERVEEALAEMDEQERETAEMRAVIAALRLAEDDPEAATAALAPVLDGSIPIADPRVWMPQVCLLEAIAREALGDANAAERALERALDLSEAEGVLLPFLLHPTPHLLERHPRHRTAHASLLSEILNLLAEREPASRASEAKPLREPLTESETRVLRYLPTNLSVQEIAGELYLSANTVKFHIRHLYAKLGAHQRSEAVERARARPRPPRPLVAQALGDRRGPPDAGGADTPRRA